MGGWFAFAGGSVGTYLVGMGPSAPVQGRLIDRYGPRGTLLVTGAVQPLLLGLLLLAQPLHLALAAIAPLAALAGAFVPPMSVLTRTLWRYRFEKPDERRTAFAIDSGLIEINFTVGPALIGPIILVGTPAAALGATRGFAELAAPPFLLLAAPRYWEHAP